MYYIWFETSFATFKKLCFLLFITLFILEEYIDPFIKCPKTYLMQFFFNLQINIYTENEWMNDVGFTFETIFT